VLFIRAYKDGFQSGVRAKDMIEYNVYEVGAFPWGSTEATELAIADGIDPPTGEALGALMDKMHGPLTNVHGKEFEVIAW
jgi:hypothetical protein